MSLPVKKKKKASKMTTMRKWPKYCEDQAFTQYNRWLWFQFSSFLLLYIAALRDFKEILYVCNHQGLNSYSEHSEI